MGLKELLLTLFLLLELDDAEDCFFNEFWPLLKEEFLEVELLLEFLELILGTASLLTAGGGFSYIKLTFADLY